MPFPPSIIAALAVAVIATGAEMLHLQRINRVRHLAFGTNSPIPAITYIAPVIRVFSIAALTWALTTLFTLQPKAHRSANANIDFPKNERRHLILLLDVSPSMKLRDAGADDKLSRTERASALLQSMLQRTTDEKLHFTMIAVYNGAKPVVKESRDIEVILNFLDGLPLSSVFPSGKTKLFDGITEAVAVAKDWPARSATLVIASDGDTVPSTGMPKLPPSIGSTLVLGVGNPTKGSFIDGSQSRQDAGTLSQIAARLGGSYHDGNKKHIPTKTIQKLGTLKLSNEKDQLNLREYALFTIAISALILAFIPIAQKTLQPQPQ